MKVLNLQCHLNHDFEGWFGSEDDFRNQLSNQMIECPMCASREIKKMLSAPRLNFGASAPASESDPSVSERALTTTQASAGAQLGPTPSPVDFTNIDPKQLQQAWLKMVNHVMSSTQDVGTEFANEARKMHYGETDERAIRGQATMDETQELLDEGIQVVPLPIPAAIKGPVQ
jgi:hypothetical protein